MPLAGRVQRVVEERDLPVLAERLQLLLEPRDLLRLGIGALEREEPDVLLRRLERVVELAVHVEQLVEALLRARRDCRARRRTSRRRRAAACTAPRTCVWKSCGRSRAVDVVADEDHELERKPLRGAWPSARPARTAARCPVPKSPSTANFSEPLAIGQRDDLSRVRPAALDAAPASGRTRRRVPQAVAEPGDGEQRDRRRETQNHGSHASDRGRTRVHVVDDEVRVGVEEDEASPTKRYSSSSGSLGSADSICGGIVDSGMASG